ncbi:bifunctional enoyl-CoA hydratase/phosphate acetyltransferase [Caldisalinibacter kiritimatiensis]|uniref:Phosphotransbutyrylase n=1 Tax=Caldisalinibacter kiritimatiensis TaxID=1304284 RepID=R1CRT0_9FIRM|nr:bifunctional enoyl-CoA hydratase/phosphate acetyltransferase [Caldisalinibacter kiritimatiensis]EOC99408.1 phosphotransbutyrylase [Caldisalinibacter kiritimatiensis]
MNTLNDMLKAAVGQRTMKLALAASQDYQSLKAVIEAAEKGIVEPILVGDIEKTKEIATENRLDIEKYEKIDAPSLEESAKVAVKLVSDKKADFLMKGLIDTSILLKEVLNKDYGLRTDSLLSHVMVYEVPTYHKLLALTDGGMNLLPSLEDKVKILKNTIEVCKALGKDVIKVAVLAAKEKVNPKMPATVDADKLKQMGQDKKFGEEVIVEGPLALDLAVSKEAAKVKGVESKVAGDADVLLVPNIEMGNGVGKSLTYFAKGKSAGVIMGAKAPVVLVSRADTHESKLYSIALGSLIASNNK